MDSISGQPFTLFFFFLNKNSGLHIRLHYFLIILAFFVMGLFIKILLFCQFVILSKHLIVNISVPGFSDETPRDYHCNLGPDGRRRDADERPELCRGTVEFVATKEFMVSLFVKYTRQYDDDFL